MLITILEGSDLTDLLDTLNAYNQDGLLRCLRIHQEWDGSVKVKVNGGMWSPPIGGIDPSSDLAQTRSL